MSDTVNIDRLVRVIRGLMDKTVNNGASEAEAASAAEKVQSLLEEYNLDLEQIATSKSDARGKEAHTAAAMYTYQRGLMKAIAEMNFCMHWIDEQEAFTFGKHRKVKRHILLGRKVNVVGTTIMYDYLVDTMDRLLPYTGMEKRGKSALRWLEGCSDRLQVRLADARAEREADAARRASEKAVRARHPGAASSGTALTIVDLTKNEAELNNDALRGWEPGTTTANRLEREARAVAQEEEYRLRRVGYEKRQQELVEQGIEASDAWYVARGYAIPTSVVTSEDVERERKPETDAQRRKREARERAESARYWSRNRDPRAAVKASAEYQAGSGVGASISLNQQVGRDNKVRIR